MVKFRSKIVREFLEEYHILLYCIVSILILNTFIVIFGCRVASPINCSSESVNSGTSSDDRHFPHLISTEFLPSPNPPIAEENSGDGAYIPMDLPLRSNRDENSSSENYMFMGAAKSNSEATSGTKSIDSSCDMSMDESASIRCYSMGSKPVPHSALPAKATMRSISHTGMAKKFLKILKILNFF